MSFSPVPFFLIWAVINSVAWGYGTTQALPWTTVVLLMCLWMFGRCPICCKFLGFDIDHVSRRALFDMDHDFKKVHFDMDYDFKKAYFDMDRDF